MKNNHILRIFLQLKNWQLFMLWILIQFLWLIEAINRENLSDNSLMDAFWGLVLLLSILMWWYSIGKILNQYLGVNRVTNYKEDLFALSYALILIVFSLIGSLGTIEYQFINELMFILWLFAIFSFYKVINFSAKVFKTMELNSPTKLRDYWKEFLLITFFFIGIWEIQPKLNQLIKNKITYR